MMTWRRKQQPPRVTYAYDISWKSPRVTMGYVLDNVKERRIARRIMIVDGDNKVLKYSIEYINY